MFTSPRIIAISLYTLLCAFFVCVCCELQGAPESILDRCTSVRINGCDKVAMTPGIRDQIIELVQRYGTGMELCQTSLAYVAFNGCEER